MCGIFGWSFGKGAAQVITDLQRITFLGALAIANEQRGDKSWGVAAVSKKNVVLIDKGVGPISRAASLGGLLRAPQGFGHTRWPTVGEVTAANAHPFQYKRWTMAHNGVIYNHLDLNKARGRTDLACAVDSQQLIRALAGELDFDDIEGYGSMEWLDAERPGSMFLCQMLNGELAVRGIWSGGEVVGTVWASSEDHLKYALDAAGIDSRRFAFEETEVMEVRGGKLFETKSRIKLTEGRRTKRWNEYQWAGEEADALCPHCGDLLPAGAGWCTNCQMWIVKADRLPVDGLVTPPDVDLLEESAHVNEAWDAPTELAIERRVADLGQQLGLLPSGSEDWKDVHGRIVKREELLDLVFEQLNKAGDKWPKVRSVKAGTTQASNVTSITKGN
jgi:hypothetical protein